MTFGELLGVTVRTESGERIGHVHDLRAELTPRLLKVTGLVVGPRGALERLGIGTRRQVIPWADVVRVDRRGVVVRDRAAA